MLNKLYIVHHTHWDREWYCSFSQFRHRLLKATEYLLDSLEDDSFLPKFLFDGQTIVLEDIKTIGSSDIFQRLIGAISQGKIEVGPWYVMPDEFLISGEAMVRNLQFGVEDSTIAGAKPDVMYLPDTFGHISQLPQLAHMFHLKSVVVARGLDEQSTDLFWQGPNCQSIHLHALPLWSGYYQDFFHSNDYLEKTKDFIRQSLAYRNTGTPHGGHQLILLAGADHTFFPGDWRQKKKLLIEELNRWEGGWQIIETSLSEAIHQNREAMIGFAKELKVEAKPPGELRVNTKSYLLSGVCSARTGLKLANVKAQRILTYQLEPLTVFASSNLIDSCHRNMLWRTLIQNHAHDSIGGCSIDAVHAENMVRFSQVIDGAEAQIQHMGRVLTKWSNQQPNRTITILNQLPLSRNLIHEWSILVPKDLDKGSIELKSIQRNADSIQPDVLPLSIISKTEHQGFSSDFYAPPNWVPSWEYIVQAELSLRPMEVQQWEIHCIEPSKEFSRVSTRDLTQSSFHEPALFDQKSLPSQLTNGIISCSLESDGTFGFSWNQIDWISKALEVVWEPDQGDSYTSSADSSRGMPGVLKEASSFCMRGRVQHQTLEYLGPENTQLYLDLELHPGEPWLRIGIRLENKAENVRLRLLIGKRDGGTKSIADIPFDLVTRTHRFDQPDFTSAQKEAYPKEWPSTSFVMASGISVYHQGFHGYDLLPDGRLGLTIVRGFSMLSKAELPERGGGAGPQLSTPQGQSLGVIKSQIMIGSPNYEEDFQRAWFGFLSPLVFQGSQYLGITPTLGIASTKVILSALFRQDENTLCMRLWNPWNYPLDVDIQVSPGASLLKVDGLLSPMEQPMLAREGAIMLVLAPAEILTYLIVDPAETGSGEIGSQVIHEPRRQK